MTREEQRNKAAKEYAEQWYKKLGTSVDEFPTDAQIAINEFIKGAEWADNHPDWHKADEELPPMDTTITYEFSKKVLVSDGEHIYVSRYNYDIGEWFVIDITVTYWMYLPEFPKED